VERLEKIQKIGKELINQEFMSKSIEIELKNMLDRWENLQHQVNKILFYPRYAWVQLSTNLLEDFKF